MATTTSTTSTTSSIVTALGGGSGIDMTALANNLAEASFNARTSRLTDQAEKVERQISEAASLKANLLALSSAIGDRIRTGDMARTPSVANGAVAGVSSGTGIANGTYSLEVTKLATAQAISSPPFASAAAVTGSGSLTIRFGTVSGTSFAEDTAHTPVTVTIPSGATLQQVASAINGANSGVTAYVANSSDGARLVFKGKEGAANGFVIDATETVGEEGLAALAFDPATASADRKLASAGDAAFKLDGVAMTSASNTIANVAPGLSLKLTATNTGSPTTITFSDPAASITSFMQDLTSALNEVVKELATDVDPVSGDLASDSGARALRRGLGSLGSRVVMPGAAPGEPRTLADLGLSIQRDGSFTLDTARLSATLAASPEAAAAMFTTGIYGVYATIDKVARTATAAGDPGSLTGSVNRYTALKTKLTKQQTDLADKQEAFRQNLLTRFAATDSRVGAAKSTLSFLQGQIDAWNSSNNN